MQAGPSALLQVRNLELERAGERLLAAFDLEVERGTIHALVGANGAGKSTLIAACLGQIAFGGEIRLHWQHSGVLGYVPQRFAPDPSLPLTVGEYLALSRQSRPVCLGLSGRTRAHVQGLLARVGMEAFLHRPLAVLSGGELRRVLLANALDPTPELLLCDEPASGVDPAFLGVLERLLCQVRAGGGTVLLVSHDHEQVRRIADRATLLAQGKAHTGRPEEVLPLMHALALG